ncbi:MAG: response regulator [Steroidobacteraceae bacterium]
MTDMISVLLVDDHAIVREGYRRLLAEHPAVRVVGEATTAPQACELALTLRPDIVVMDIALPGMSGIEATRRMLKYAAPPRVLMFSMHEDAIYATRALQAGALGYLSKASAPEVLMSAIYAVWRGERYLSPDVAMNMERAALPEHSLEFAPLTPREFEVLRLLVRGATVKSIGETLGLSEKTIANHQSAIREKLGAKNSLQLSLLAERHGLLP